MTVHAVFVHVERRWLTIEEPAQFLSQFSPEFVQPSFVHDGTNDMALVKRRRDALLVAKKGMEPLPNGGLNLLGFEVFLLFAGHSKGAAVDAPHGFGRVAINPKHEVWYHGCCVHVGHLLNTQRPDNALVDDGGVDVAVRHHHGALFQQRSDEGMGVIQPVSCEQTGFLQGCFVPQFHRGQRQLPQFRVTSRFVGHGDLGKSKILEQFSENPRCLALPRTVPTLHGDEVHVQSSLMSS